MSEFLEPQEEGKAPPPPPQPRPPRRSETLPVRFNNPVAVGFDGFPGRRRRQAYQDPRQPQAHGQYPPRERTRAVPAGERYLDYDDDYEIGDPGRGNRRTEPGVLSDRTERPPPPPRERARYSSDEEDLDVHFNRRAGMPHISNRIPNRRQDYDEYDNLRLRRRRSRSPPLDRGHDSFSDDDEDDRFGARRYSPTRRHYHEHSSGYLIPAVSKGAQRSRPTGLRTPAPVIINNRIYNDAEVDDNESNFDANSQAYSFTLSRYSKSLRGSESIGSVSDTSEKGDSPEGDAMKDTEPGNTRCVYRSQYVGDGTVGGRHKVQLTVMPDSTSTSRRGVAPIFKWVHFEDMNMDFDQFQKNTLSVTGLTDSERNAITKLLGRAKKRHDRPLQTSRQTKTRFMVPSFMQETISGEMRPKASKSRSIFWMCVPYFCLDKYGVTSGLRSSSHPMRTLLQARFSMTEKQRDLQQAVCYLPDTPNEHCFHIAQVWFLILDDSLIISCAQNSISILQGESIDTCSLSPLESPLPISPNILVSVKSLVTWSLPVNQCETWFALISHFWEYWPRTFEIKFNEKVLTSVDWPRIVVLAKKSSIHLSLEFKSTIKEPVRGILLEDPISEEGFNEDLSQGIGKAPAESRAASEHSSPNLQVKDQQKQKSSPILDLVRDGFHVFTWLNANTDEQKPGKSPILGMRYMTPLSGSIELEMDLNEIDEFLSRKTSLNDRLTYRSCPFQQRVELYRLLAKERRDITAASDSTQVQREMYENKVDILNAADSSFQFFFPAGFQGSTVGKYWGALFQLLEAIFPTIGIEVRSSLLPIRDVVTVLDWLKTITRKVAPFRDLFSQIQVTERHKINIPEELSRAWLQLLMALAFVLKDIDQFEDQMLLCSDLLDQGMRKAVQQLSEVHLSEYVVFTPFDLASLITFELSQDITGSGMDISEIYMEYIKMLESDIEGKPLDRGHQDRLEFLKQEVAVINETLGFQSKVLSLAWPGTGQTDVVRVTNAAVPLVTGRSRSRSHVRNTTYYEEDDNPGTYYHSPLPVTYMQPTSGSNPQQLALSPSGVQGLVFQDSLALIDKRVRDFRQIRDRAVDLGEWNIQKIDSNKDRQEAAVFAFTIVTIIFLPLSTVAGILGMNTNDVRNMTVNQWVFWATALPLTILIITLCLIWAGELNNFWNGFTKMWRKTPRNYAPIPAIPVRFGNGSVVDYIDGDPRAPRMRQVRRSNPIYGGRRDSYV